jgi:hypothetical protein
MVCVELEAVILSRDLYPTASATCFGSIRIIRVSNRAADLQEAIVCASGEIPSSVSPPLWLKDSNGCSAGSRPALYSLATAVAVEW